jgi:EGF-like domain
VNTSLVTCEVPAGTGADLAVEVYGGGQLYLLANAFSYGNFMLCMSSITIINCTFSAACAKYTCHGHGTCEDTGLCACAAGYVEYCA